MSEKANKYKKVDTTLTSGSWIGSSTPYTYTLSISEVTATSDINIVLNSTDKNIANAWMHLAIINGTQNTNSVTLYAYGKKPSVDIPISLLIGDEVKS